MNREPLRQVIDVGRVDLATDRKQYEEKWQKLGFEEGRELVEMTTNLINELRQLAEGIDHELERLGSRLGPAQQITGSASQLVTELPQELNEFARRVSRLLNQVAGPRYEWLMAIESRRQALAQVASNLQTLEQDAAGSCHGCHRSQFKPTASRGVTGTACTGHGGTWKRRSRFATGVG